MSTCKYRIMLMGSLILLSCTLRFTVEGIHTLKDAENYLSKYGYLSYSRNQMKSDHFMMNLKKITDALMDFQSFAGLNKTGYLDGDTIHYMNMPRCGVKDIIKIDKNSRSRRSVSNLEAFEYMPNIKNYIHSKVEIGAMEMECPHYIALKSKSGPTDFTQSKFNEKKLLYKISKYTRKLSYTTINDLIQRAFMEWSKVTPLTFTQKNTGKVHIEIQFQKFTHTKKYNRICNSFDGPGGVLAHAYFPKDGGDAHFDDSEMWSKYYEGINFFQVAVHEIGHALGLPHSDVRSSVMAPFYNGYNPSFKLDSSDIRAIQALYGTNTLAERPDNYDDSPSRESGITAQEPLVTYCRDGFPCDEEAIFNKRHLNHRETLMDILTRNYEYQDAHQDAHQDDFYSDYEK